jgi:predicted HTH domain antitoxin
MQTTTLSVRLPLAEAAYFERAAKEVGLERPALLKLALHKGCAEFLFEKACADYRNGRITLSRAAERARLSVRDFIARLPSAGVELNYGVGELAEDMAP